MLELKSEWRDDGKRWWWWEMVSRGVKNENFGVDFVSRKQAEDTIYFRHLTCRYLYDGKLVEIPGTMPMARTPGSGKVCVMVVQRDSLVGWICYNAVSGERLTVANSGATRRELVSWMVETHGVRKFFWLGDLYEIEPCTDVEWQDWQCVPFENMEVKK